MVGVLRAVDGTSITLSGNVRLLLAPGIQVKGIPLNTSVTVRVVFRNGALYADVVRETPPAFA